MLTVLLASAELQSAPKLHPVLPAQGRPSTALNAMLGVLLPALLSAPESHVLQGRCGAPKALGSSGGKGMLCMLHHFPPPPPLVLHQPLLFSSGLSSVCARSVLALGSGASWVTASSCLGGVGDVCAGGAALPPRVQCAVLCKGGEGSAGGVGGKMFLIR